MDYSLLLGIHNLDVSAKEAVSWFAFSSLQNRFKKLIWFTNLHYWVRQ